MTSSFDYVIVLYTVNIHLFNTFKSFLNTFHVFSFVSPKQLMWHYYSVLIQKIVTCSYVLTTFYLNGCKLYYNEDRAGIFLM